MRHIPILINFFALSFGIACLGRLFLQLQQKKSRYGIALIGFFSSFSYLMILTTVFAYWFVNIDFSETTQLLFTGLVFFGMGFLELTLPELVFAERSLYVSKKNKVFFSISALWTIFQAPLLWSSFLGPLFWLSIVFSFIPFICIMAYSLVFSFRHGLKKHKTVFDKLLGFLYLPAVALGMLDAWRLNHLTSGEGFIALSLPVVYGISSCQILFEKLASVVPVTEALKLELPPAQADILTPREQAITRLILEGYGNKEIAGTLNLSGNTIRNHIYNLYQKLGIQKRMDLVRLCSEKAASGTKILKEKAPSGT